MGVNNTVSSPAAGVEVHIGTSYDNIKKVADNLEALLLLNESFVNLNGIYLGQFALAPVQRADTSALQSGDHYLNTSANGIYFYLDGNWIFYKVFYTQDALNTAVGQGPFKIHF